MDYQASIGFGVTDGANHWYNRQSDGSSYSYMSWDAANYNWVGSQAYCMIGSNWQHPDMNYESVRVWLAPASGRIKVSSIGSISVGNGTSADGVKVK